MQPAEMSGTMSEQSYAILPVAGKGTKETKTITSTTIQATSKLEGEPAAAAVAPFANGYHSPPKHTFGQSMKLECIAFWNYFLAPLGFVITIYGLNVVAWGGMLFLLQCNACFGLATWRFRDLYLLLQYRLLHKPVALRRLAGTHRGWFRLEGSTDLPVNLGPTNIDEQPSQAVPRSAIPFPEKTIPNAPLTGVRARPTMLWKLDLAIWFMVWNTFLQCCLSGFMWALNRYDRLSWSTGLFVVLPCIVAAIGGLIMLIERNTVKSVEGVPVSQKGRERLEQDLEHGIWSRNNIKDEHLESKKKKEEENKRKSEL
ncbi:hypothetical protein N7526_007725 [Penicillium atrosanguineum]|nr:hypothetical protein N7526_007725 [Penicillium atrosanguineum]